MSRSRRINKREKQFIGWIIVLFVFAIVFIISFVHNLFVNCIFHWPIRWDFGTCWHEQIAPAKQKAAESASNFIP